MEPPNSILLGCGDITTQTDMKMKFFTEKYGAIQVYFGEVALLCLALHMYKYYTIQRIIFELKFLRKCLNINFGSSISKQYFSKHSTVL